MGSSHIGINKKAWSYKTKQGRRGHIGCLPFQKKPFKSDCPSCITARHHLSERPTLLTPKTRRMQQFFQGPPADRLREECPTLERWSEIQSQKCRTPSYKRLSQPSEKNNLYKYDESNWTQTQFHTIPMCSGEHDKYWKLPPGLN